MFVHHARSPDETEPEIPATPSQPRPRVTAVFRSEVLHVYGLDSVRILFSRGDNPPNEGDSLGNLALRIFRIQYAAYHDANCTLPFASRYANLDIDTQAPNIRHLGSPESLPSGSAGRQPRTHAPGTV